MAFHIFLLYRSNKIKIIQKLATMCNNRPNLNQIGKHRYGTVQRQKQSPQNCQSNRQSSDLAWGKRRQLWTKNTIIYQQEMCNKQENDKIGPFHLFQHHLTTFTFTSLANSYYDIFLDAVVCIWIQVELNGQPEFSSHLIKTVGGDSENLFYENLRKLSTCQTCDEIMRD